MSDRQSMVFVRARSRAVAIRPAVNISKTALVFERLEGGEKARSTARFQPSDTLDFTEYELLHTRPVYGCLGLVQVGNDLFLGIVTEAVKIAELEGAPVYRIQRVAFHSLLTDKYDAAARMSADSMRDQMTEESVAALHPCQPLVKLLCTGSFYFSPTLDLTRSAQRRNTDVQQGGSAHNIFENADAHFVWNKHLLSGLLQIREQELSAPERDDLDAGGLLVLAIQGFVGMADYTMSGDPYRMALISRLSCKRAGTRLLSRGVNDDGHVSNFVETEFLVYHQHMTFSFVQVRGSVPVFWEQTGIQMTHKVTISRGAESSAPATRKHFEELLSRYNRVHIVNLLAQKDGSSEAMLSECFRQSVARMPDLADLLKYTEFDFHAAVKRDGYERVSELITMVQTNLEQYSYFLADVESNAVFSQQGVIRTNCLDCLDRTNVVQTRLARHALESHFKQFAAQFYPAEVENFAAIFNGIWADNGDWLSRIYAGTGALKSSYTRKGKSTVLGFLDDAAKSVNRFYINNFQDKTRQEAIDLLLGKLANSETVLLRNPLHESVRREMRSRLAEYSSPSKISMFLGTWNVNGKMTRGESLDTWLNSNCIQFPHIYAIGIQELIELTPGQYISADTNKLRLEWEAALMRAVNTTAGTSYVLLRSIHLVALGIFVFVRADSVAMIRHVESSVKKTGLGGMAANKGGIGISFSANDTSIALVTAHLAAGQAAVEERNRDYWTIHDGLRFRGRRLSDYDMVFWFGDFNYRVNLPNEEIRARVKRGEIDHLYVNDQLSEQRANGLAFEGFQEGPITFDPTYKYDNGTHMYDTSEKARSPAWTDRILYAGRRIDLKEYGRGEMLISDHRPVRAVFELDTVIIDREKKDALRREVYKIKMAEKDVSPPLPVRAQGPPTMKSHRPPSTGLLIDLAEDPDPPQQRSIFGSDEKIQEANRY
ncbi:SacI homology domain-containing protein [Phlyctochytrium arcticum]|nr:SacI homology domain-containing protein [Phlyctochytrium arcticum]